MAWNEMIGCTTFLYEENLRVSRFCTWWKVMHEEDGDSYPSWMPKDTWEKEYRAWKNSDICTDIE